MKPAPVGVLMSLSVLIGVALAISPPATADSGGFSEASWCVDNPVIQAESLPSSFSTSDCPVVGRVIRDNGIGAKVPPAGTGIFAEGYGLNTQVLIIEHEHDGTIRLSSLGREPVMDGDDYEVSVPVSHEFDTGGPECADQAHEPTNWSESDDHKWFVNQGTYPG
jgi:hypothetical protein